jgi:hypothetical protein
MGKIPFVTIYVKVLYIWFKFAHWFLKRRLKCDKGLHTVNHDTTAAWGQGKVPWGQIYNLTPQ